MENVTVLKKRNQLAGVVSRKYKKHEALSLKEALQKVS